MKSRLVHGVRKGFKIVVVGRIIVPGYGVQAQCHLPVIQPTIEPHEIRCHWNIRCHPVQHGYLIPHKINHIPGGKTLPLHIQPHNAGFTIDIRGFYLRKRIIVMAPERSPPFRIQPFNIIFILLRQIHLKFLHTPGTEALPSQFIGDMVHHHTGMCPQAFRQHPVNNSHFISVPVRSHTMIVALAVMVTHSPVIHTHRFKIFSIQPGRPCPRRRGQYSINLILIQLLYNLLHPFKMIIPLFRFISCPGKYSQCHTVDTGLFHHAHIRIQNIRSIQPLFRIIIASMNQTTYLRKKYFLLHACLPPSLTFLIRAFISSYC